MANPCCCNFIYRLGVVGIHQRCNFLDLEFSSGCSWLTNMLIIFQTVCPLCKTFVLLKHSTTAQGFFAICLLDHLKRFASGFV
jgi:hypothetical protein